MPPAIVSVSLSPAHTFSKPVADEVRVVAGLGIQGDAHSGALVRHRYHVRKNPHAPNLGQVHLLASELFAELAAQGLPLGPGELGENITTAGLDLVELPLDTLLHLGPSAVVRITGLRQPCSQMDGLRPGLMHACFNRSRDGRPPYKSGVYATALVSGIVRPGEAIAVELPPGPHRRLGPV